jgi:hypothetical protein
MIGAMLLQTDVTAVTARAATAALLLGQSIRHPATEFWESGFNEVMATYG